MNKLFICLALCVLGAHAMEEFKLNTRQVISLNEALRLGTLVAKENTLEFPDFESSPTSNRPTHSMPLANINPYIYSLLMKTNTHYCVKGTDLVKGKVLQNLQLTEQDILNFQIPSILAFLSNMDIDAIRKDSIAQIQADNNLTPNQKMASVNVVKFSAEMFLLNRSLYKGALATQNPDTINARRTERMYFEEKPLTIVQELAKLREEIHQ